MLAPRGTLERQPTASPWCATTYMLRLPDSCQYLLTTVTYPFPYPFDVVDWHGCKQLEPCHQGDTVTIPAMSICRQDDREWWLSGREHQQVVSVFGIGRDVAIFKQSTATRHVERGTCFQEPPPVVSAAVHRARRGHDQRVKAGRGHDRAAVLQGPEDVQRKRTSTPSLPRQLGIWSHRVDAGRTGVDAWQLAPRHTVPHRKNTARVGRR